MHKNIKIKKQPVYARIGTVSLEEVLDFVPLEKDSSLPTRKEFFGKSMKLTSDRYKVYSVKGTICVKCGLRGTYFAVEQSIAQKTDKYHFNLYAINRQGEEIMMTIDHIIPKSRGGTDTLQNKQCMCFTCNNKKGNNLPKVDNTQS